MSVVGVLTNCGVLGYTSQQLRTHLEPWVGVLGLALILFALEHVVLLFKCVVCTTSALHLASLSPLSPSPLPPLSLTSLVSLSPS